jgi:hypothetical protein
MLVSSATQACGRTLRVPFEKVRPAGERCEPNEPLEPPTVVVRAHCVAPDRIVYIYIYILACVNVMCTFVYIFIYIHMYIIHIYHVCIDGPTPQVVYGLGPYVHMYIHKYISTLIVSCVSARTNATSCTWDESSVHSVLNKREAQSLGLGMVWSLVFRV